MLSLTVPAMHSNPAAPATLFLDFDGHAVDTVSVPVYDADGDATSFSAAELALIEDLWQVVAEDFAPFNLDVTTVEPAVLAPGVPDSQANGVALRIAIGGVHENGLAGLAYHDSFTTSPPNVAWVYAQGQTDPIKYGTIASHEAGHSFGLRHQTLTSNPELTWQPIMAGATGIDHTTWHNGIAETGLVQDDMAHIARPANVFGYRPDDHASAIGGATPLSGGGTSFTGSGIIATTGDVDMFSLTTSEPQNLRITVEGDALAQNLDAVVELRDASGALLVSGNPGDSLDAFVIGDVAGTLYVAVKSSGVYGWVGQYTVTVSESLPGVRVATSGSPFTTSESGRSETITLVLDARPTADVTFNVASSDPTEGTVSTSQVVFTAANWYVPQVVTITGVADGITDGAVGYTVAVSPAVSGDPAYSGFDPADLAVVNLDDAPGQVYWLEQLIATDDAYVKRGSLAGENEQTLVDIKAAFGPPASLYTPSYLALDPAAGKMYWTDHGSDTIRRANLDGSSSQTVVSGLPNPTGIAVDAAGGKIYWADSTLKKIQRANLDGSAVQDVLTVGLNNPGELEIDVVAGKMYWTDSNNFTISRANLDGSAVEIVLPSDGINRPNGLELDVAGGKMYYILRNSTTSGLFRADLNGANQELLLDAGSFHTGLPTTGFNRPAIDRAGGRIFWSSSNVQRIYSANLDGSNVAVVAEGAVGVTGVAILPATPGFLVSPTAGLTTTEAGGAASFTVALSAPPVANVVVPIASSDTTEGTVSAASLTFTPGNWSVPQTVSVVGVDDAVYDQNVAYTVVLGAASSGDPAYNSLNPADVAVVNLDNDPPPTKFYVVNDASQNQTFEYNPSGGLVESYGLNGGNSTPRGAASTVAGDKTWVVDANRKVYVYNPSGGLLGSWTAGTLANNATVEGIATNGTDVWIVDAKSDKVFRYAGAATRLAGSQNAASSFNLNGNNSSPKDLVTDGVSLWVVNDASNDKVFKYTVAGSLLGSWTMGGGGGSPTGLTLDPASVSDLWVVDSATDRVYRFAAAASRTSGSQSASSSFALAAGNTNPQGIADPPVGRGDLDVERPSHRERDALFAALADDNSSEWGDQRPGHARARRARER